MTPPSSPVQSVEIPVASNATPKPVLFESKEPKLESPDRRSCHRESGSHQRDTIHQNMMNPKDFKIFANSLFIHVVFVIIQPVIFNTMKISQRELKQPRGSPRPEAFTLS